jgi:hypothetical protein
MTNNAQLLPLPEDREEFEMFIIRHLGPGALAGDKISIHDAAELAFAKGIEHGRNALACIEAAKPVNVDWLLEAMNEAIGEIDCGAQYTAQNVLRSALATYEAAQGKTPPPEQA